MTSWAERRRDRRQRRRHETRRQRWKRRRDSACDRCECGCDVFDCFSFLSLMVIVRAFLGVFRASAVDPHTTVPRSPAGRLASRAVRSYQLNVSAHRSAPVCNLSPSCSRYGLRVLSSHGVLRGGVLIARRLRECRAAASCARN